jgi:hypothetical protein
MAKKIEKVNLGSHGTFEVHKGKLHEALGIPSDEKIPEQRLDSALHSNKPSIRHMAASAKGFKAMKH